jgi:hypothetical protein
MPTTAVVIVMTPTHREKVPASAALPRSSEARYPQGSGPFVLFSPPRLPRRRCVIRAALALSRPASSAGRPHRPGAHTGRHRGSSSVALPHLGCAHAQASAGPMCMCARAAACRVQRRTSGLRRSDASRVDTAEMASLPRWTSGEVLGPSRRRGGFALSGAADQDAARCGPQAWRMAHGASTPARGTSCLPKSLVELTLRGAQTGRNDWAASEPVTDNPSSRRV